MSRVLFVSLCAALVSGFAPPCSLSSRHQSLLQSVLDDAADCIDDDSCSPEVLETLMAEVKSKAAEIKELEAKLTALNKDDSSTLKKMLAAEECELNGFDGCAAWYYDD